MSQFSKADPGNFSRAPKIQTESSESTGGVLI